MGQLLWTFEKYNHLCKTTENIVVGGYTPIAFNNEGWPGIYDLSGESFTFSLTKNLKYKGTEDRYLIRRDNSRIAFSYHLNIVDRADIKNNSKYFLGENTCQFRVTEW